MKIIGDAFAGESKIDDDMANRREKYALSPGKSVTAQRRSVISKPPEPPCRINSVCPQTARNKRSGTTGKRRRDRLLRFGCPLNERGRRTDCQNKSCRINRIPAAVSCLKKSEESYVNELADARNEIQTENAVIRQTKIERLKSNSMGAAFEQADAVMGAASDEIMGMLIAEGKDHIDEKQEEEKKTAEEAADKRRNWKKNCKPEKTKRTSRKS